jgi:hypothetical protein
VQEGLTNALRYATTATAVRVVIVFQPGTVVITVDDDAAVHPETEQGSGRGLVGLRERVGLYGGTMEAGPRPGGGWRVRTVFDAVRTRPDAGAPDAGAADPGPAPSGPTDPHRAGSGPASSGRGHSEPSEPDPDPDPAPAPSASSEETP